MKKFLEELGWAIGVFIVLMGLTMLYAVANNKPADVYFKVTPQSIEAHTVIPGK